MNYERPKSFVDKRMGIRFYPVKSYGKESTAEGVATKVGERHDIFTRVRKHRGRWWVFTGE